MTDAPPVDNWVIDQATSLAATLADLERVIEDESDVIVEHRRYRGASSPERFVCSDFNKLRERISAAAPGDAFYFWRFEDCCRDDNITARGKVPNSRGEVPLGGSY